MASHDAQTPTSAVAEGADIRGWGQYHGLLVELEDPCGTSRLFGFEGVERDGKFTVEHDGGTFLYAMDGRVRVSDEIVDWELLPGQWAALPGGCSGQFTTSGSMVCFQKDGFHGLRATGGPIEERGRLRYIDGCSDTLLAGPPVLGQPCLNHLHFPPSTLQTTHTHPSARLGIVAQGTGICRTPAGDVPLTPGLVFAIPRGGRHGFITEQSSMDVIAYHPDSDWGPTDENHPMVNRTWVDGEKIDNSAPAHAGADVVGRARSEGSPSGDPQGEA